MFLIFYVYFYKRIFFLKIWILVQSLCFFNGFFFLFNLTKRKNSKNNIFFYQYFLYLFDVTHEWWVFFDLRWDFLWTTGCTDNNRGTTILHLLHIYTIIIIKYKMTFDEKLDTHLFLLFSLKSACFYSRFVWLFEISFLSSF